MNSSSHHSRAQDAATGEQAVAWAQAADRTGGVARTIRAKARRNQQRRMAAVGVVSAIAVTFGAIFYRDAAEPTIPAPTRTAVVSLPQREVLPDGTVVDLRDGAKVAVQFSADPAIRRVVLSQGEAHFSVAKDPNRPFIVVAAGVDVRAVGTSFSVALEANKVAVVVTEGRVAVQRPDENGPVEIPLAPAMLDAGQSVVVDLATAQPAQLQPVAVAPTEMAQAMAWRAPRIRFANTPLHEAIAVFNEHSSTQLELQPGLEELRVGGIIRADNTDSFLLLLKGEFGIDAQATADGRLQLRK